MTWNCRVGDFRGKAQHIAPLRPDVLAVQEVERIDGQLLFAGEHQPTFKDRLPGPPYARRGIGVFSYTDLRLEAVDHSETLHGFRRFEAFRSDGLQFNVVGIWTSAPKYRQSHDGLERHQEWILKRPTVLLGDFNVNAGFLGRHWRDLINLIDPLGLASAYHQFFNETFGSESRPTHFFRGDPSKRFHLDYCFIPADWMRHLKGVTVGAHSDWHSVSDHVPLVVDVDV